MLDTPHHIKPGALPRLPAAITQRAPRVRRRVRTNTGPTNPAHMITACRATIGRGSARRSRHEPRGRREVREARRQQGSDKCHAEHTRTPRERGQPQRQVDTETNTPTRCRCLPQSVVLLPDAMQLPLGRGTSAMGIAQATRRGVQLRKQLLALLALHLRQARAQHARPAAHVLQPAAAQRAPQPEAHDDDRHPPSRCVSPPPHPTPRTAHSPCSRLRLAHGCECAVRLAHGWESVLTGVRGQHEGVPKA